jgi:Rtf2 RING-finger
MMEEGKKMAIAFLRVTKSKLMSRSIPTRRELVKEAARDPTTTELKEILTEKQEYFWTTCPVSQKPLTTPVVSDSSGKLYNKDAILEFLLPSDDGAASKGESEEVLQGRVRSLRDIVDLKFEIDGDASPERRNGEVRVRRERWVCPITRRELGPGVKAVYLIPCGHVFDESAVKEVPGNNCLVVSVCLDEI